MFSFASFFPYFITASFGLVIGSFLNVLICRIPRNESIVHPPSRCPECLSPIRPWDNIPIFSYLALKGRCRKCGVVISPVYPLIEAATSVMFVSLYFLHGMSVNFISDVLFGCILLTMSVVDIRHMIIPDRLTIPGGVIGFAIALSFGIQGIVRAIGGALIGVFLLIIMAFAGRLLFKRESMGLGDFKLVIVTGFFLGPIWNLAALIFAVLIGGIVFSILLGVMGMSELVQ